MASEQKKEAIFEASGLMSGGLYIPSILTSAAYPSYYDEDIMNVELSQDTIKNILEVMKLYNRQEFGVDPEWEKKSYVENLNNLDILSRSLVSLNPDTYQYVGVYLSGGRSGGLNLHNSILLDLAYFYSMYEQNNEEVVFYGIPTDDNENAYSANITVLALGSNTTKYPKAVYELAKYMMDYEYPTAYGFSANKEITKKQLDSIQNTTISLYSDYIWSSITAGVKTKKEIENDIEVVKPLPEELVNRIRNMLDHIEGAGLPNGILEHTIYTSALHKIGNNEMSCTEASEWVIELLQEYLIMSESLEPFYDKEYISLMLETQN